MQEHQREGIENEAPEGKEGSLQYMQGTQREEIENEAPEGKEGSL